MAATDIAGDYRRTDQRTNILEKPFWVTSGIVSCAVCTGKSALLFSFPKAGQIIIVEEVVVQNIVLAVGGTSISIGSATIASNAITTDGALSIVDADEYWSATDYAVTAGAIKGSVTTTDWLTPKASGSFAAPRFITGVAATTVPVVYAQVGASFTAGTFRVHMLITIIPGT